MLQSRNAVAATDVTGYGSWLQRLQSGYDSPGKTSRGEAWVPGRAAGSARAPPVKFLLPYTLQYIGLSAPQDDLRLDGIEPGRPRRPHRPCRTLAAILRR